MIFSTSTDVIKADKPQSKGQLPGLSIKVYWNTAIPIRLLLYEATFMPTWQLNSYKRHHMAPKPKIFTVWPLMGKFSNPIVVDYFDGSLAPY